MEERPSDRAHEKRYNHGGERSSSRTKTSLKNDPSQCQHQETQTKKTGNGRVNGSPVEREFATRSASDSVGVACSASANGHPSQLDANWKPKQLGRAPPTASKPGSRGGVACGNGVMDSSRSERAPELLAHEGKKEPASLPNGVSLPLGPGFFTNGYPGNKPPPPPAPDNDGSGSESGCATPKKRKPLRGGGGKGAESVTQPPPPPDTPEAPPPEAPPPEPPEKGAGPAARAEARAHRQPVAVAIPPPAATFEPQRRTFDGKAAGAHGRKQDERPGRAKPGPGAAAASAKEKDDSWTLFRPPPVFPVDNSSAKIVPKISYASKVKENLNKAGGEVPGPCSSGPQPAPPQAPARPAQVPMSAMKTITSSAFTNGALEAGAYSLTGTLFASTVPPENVAPPGDEAGGSPDAAALLGGEARKPSLFVYPLAPSSSNMQLALPSGRQTDPPGPGPAPSSAPTNQKALGDIFQNQWGLSFINDPSAGPEGGVAGAGGGAGRVPGAEPVTEVTFQGGCPVAPPTPCEESAATPPPPKAPEPEKRTSPQTHSSVLKAGPPPAPPPVRESPAQASGPDGQKDAAEARNPGAIVFSSPKDPTTPPLEALWASPGGGVSSPLARGSAHSKGLDRGWGSFDLKAAVRYHTKEMECILNLQKQDPKRVVLYDETKDGPNQ